MWVCEETPELLTSQAFLEMHFCFFTLLGRKINVCGVMGLFLPVQQPGWGTSSSLPPTDSSLHPVAGGPQHRQSRGPSPRRGQSTGAGSLQAVPEEPRALGGESRSPSASFEAVARVQHLQVAEGGRGLVCLTPQGGRPTVRRPL